jgi:hypothetical protein
MLQECQHCSLLSSGLASRTVMSWYALCVQAQLKYFVHFIHGEDAALKFHYLLPDLYLAWYAIEVK